MSLTTTDGDLLQEGPLGWQRQVPLGRMLEVPGLPLALLPTWLGEWAAAVADSVQVPVDVPALVGLTVAAAGVARKFRVHVRSDWAEPTNLYSAVVLRTGERKSKVFELAIASLRSLTGKLRRQNKKQSVSSRFSRGIMAAKLRKLAKNLTDCSDEAEVEPLLEQGKGLMLALEVNTPPPCPVLVADDQALDLLGQLMIEQGRRMLIAWTIRIDWSSRREGALGGEDPGIVLIKCIVWRGGRLKKWARENQSLFHQVVAARL